MVRVTTKETKTYLIELTAEERELFFKRMEQSDIANHPYSILGAIQAELRRV